MKNHEIKLSFTLEAPNRRGYFMGYQMGLWQIIFKQGDKHLSKLLPRSLYGSIHFLLLLSAQPCSPITHFKVFQIRIIIVIVIRITKNSNLLYNNRDSSRNYKQQLLILKFLKKILRHIFSKINRCIVQKPGAVLTQNSPSGTLPVNRMKGFGHIQVYYYESISSSIFKLVKAF